MNYQPFHTPLYLMAKPAGSACNLRCSYCYYLEKGDVLQQPVHRMSPRVLERFIKSYIEAQSGPEVTFVWHGGEATLLGIEYYEQVMTLQRRHGRGRTIVNALQTNGTLLTDDWCRFLHDNGWLVGVSIDGPDRFHNPYRTDVHGHGSHGDVLRGIKLLQQYGVEWNAMAVVNNLNVKEPEAFYNYFKSIGCNYLQFTPIVERTTTDGHLAMPHEQGTLTPQSVTPGEWGDFLCRIFDLWYSRDVGRVYVQIFESTLASTLGLQPGLCTLGNMCGHAGIVEANGDVYSCDHFAFPQYKLGNIMSNSAFELMTSEAQRRFAAIKTSQLDNECRQCEFLHLCHGECPKNRFVNSNHNYLCQGYKQYFKHTSKAMAAMAQELRAH